MYGRYVLTIRLAVGVTDAAAAVKITRAQMNIEYGCRP